MNEIAKRKHRMKQRGFTLFELTIAASLMAVMTYMLLLVWMSESQRMQSKLAGQQYKIIQDGLNDYLALFHDDLLKLSKNCSTVSYAENVSLAVPYEISHGSCHLNLLAVNGARTSVLINNGLQPTIAELKSLRLIDATFRNALMLPTNAIIATPINNKSSSTLAPPEFAIQITKVCPTTNCNDYQLTGLIFNKQPYSLTKNNSMISGIETILDALAAAGPDAAASTTVQYSGDSELHGWNDLFKLTNPLRNYSAGGTSRGSSGVLAVRSGFGSASMSQFARLDGSRNITGNWNFNGHTVTGIQQVTADNMNIQSLITGKNMNLSGSVTTNDVQTGTVNTSNLRVSGTSNINQAKVDNLVLPQASIGQVCQASVGTLAMSTSGYLVVCRGGLWTLN